MDVTVTQRKLFGSDERRFDIERASDKARASNLRAGEAISLLLGMGYDEYTTLDLLTSARTNVFMTR